jgi:hypothetical protein
MAGRRVKPGGWSDWPFLVFLEQLEENALLADRFHDFKKAYTKAKILPGFQTDHPPPLP